MNDRVQPLLTQQTLGKYGVADISMDKTKIRSADQWAQRIEISGIGQRIEHHQALAGMLLQPIMNEVCTDEAGATGYQKSWHKQGVV